jgi:hypothetical protein
MIGSARESAHPAKPIQSFDYTTSSAGKSLETSRQSRPSISIASGERDRILLDLRPDESSSLQPLGE